VTKRTLAWSMLITLGLGAVLAAAWSAFGTNRVTLGQADLQARIDKMLPKRAKDVTVQHLRITLTDDRMLLRVEAEVDKLGQHFTVAASASGRPRYESDDAALFFEPDIITIEDLTLQGGSMADRVETAAGRLKGRLGEIVKDRAPEIDAAAARIAEQGIKFYLSTFPIYRLKDDAKGLAVRTVLRAVAIENGTLVVTFSVWGLTFVAAALALLVLLLAALVVQLIRNPRWGLPHVRT